MDNDVLCMYMCVRVCVCVFVYTHTNKIYDGISILSRYLDM